MITFEEPIDPQLRIMLERLKKTPSRDGGSAFRGRSKFLAEAAHLRAATVRAGTDETPHPKKRGSLFSTNHRERPARKPFLRLSTATMLLIVVLIVILLLSGTGVTVYAAQSSLPGDALYPVKHAAEGARLTLTGDAGEDASLHLLFAHRRLDEIRSLIDRDRFEFISLGTNEFERNILGAIAAIRTVAVSDPIRSELLAAEISATLTDYAEELTSLASSVSVDASRQALERAYRASRITVTAAQVEFTAFVEAIGPESWVIGGLIVYIDQATEIAPGIQIGDIVEVHAGVEGGDRLVAHEIELADTDDDSELEIVGTVESISAGVWVIAGQEVVVALETEIEDAIGVGDLVKVEARQEADGAFIALDIKLAGEEHDSDDLGEIEISGVVESMAAGFWVIDGQQVRITASTEIKDSIQVGDFVRVKADEDSQGTLTATEIGFEDHGDDLDDGDDTGASDDDDDDDNSGGDDDDGDSIGDDDDEEMDGEDDDDDSSGGDDDHGDEGDDDHEDDHEDEHEDDEEEDEEDDD